MDKTIIVNAINVKRYLIRYSDTSYDMATSNIGTRRHVQLCVCECVHFLSFSCVVLVCFVTYLAYTCQTRPVYYVSLEIEVGRQTELEPTTAAQPLLL